MPRNTFPGGSTKRAVNTSLTLRNWLIGFHIAEYEQQGADRAQYGDKLLDRLSERLAQAGVSRAEARELRRYRQFYWTYPRIRESLSPELARTLLPHPDPARVTTGAARRLPQDSRAGLLVREQLLNAEAQSRRGKRWPVPPAEELEGFAANGRHWAVTATITGDTPNPTTPPSRSPGADVLAGVGRFP